MAGTAEYNTWKKMRSRCENPNNKDFPYYGGKGVIVCDRWKQDFQNFLDDMGARPKGLTIERRDVSGPYSSENCYWADRKTQARNRTSVRPVTANGQTMTFTEACERIGLHRATVQDRLNSGWSEEDALSTPSLGTGRSRRSYIG